MRKTFTFAALSAALFTASAASAATLIPVPAVPGSTVTFVGGINDNNVIVGSYFDADMVQHAYVGTLGGQYTTFDFDAVKFPGTNARDIDNDGNIVGTANTPQPLQQVVEFERFADGTMKPVGRHRTRLHGSVGGLGAHGVFAVENWNGNNTVDGFLARNAKVTTQLSLGFVVSRLRPRDVSDRGEVAGYFQTPGGGTSKGFLLHDNKVDVIEFPDERAVNGTLLQSINGKGTISGYWMDAEGQPFAFTYDRNTTAFKSIHIPHYAHSTASGVNAAGLIAVQAYGADPSQTAPFIYCPKPPGKCPGEGFAIPDPKPVFMPAHGLRLRKGAAKQAAARERFEY